MMGNNPVIAPTTNLLVWYDPKAIPVATTPIDTTDAPSKLIVFASKDVPMTGIMPRVEAPMINGALMYATVLSVALNTAYFLGFCFTEFVNVDTQPGDECILSIWTN